jgi:hypothetical protein
MIERVQTCIDFLEARATNPNLELKEWCSRASVDETTLGKWLRGRADGTKRNPRLGLCPNWRNLTSEALTIRARELTEILLTWRP